MKRNAFVLMAAVAATLAVVSSVLAQPVTPGGNGGPISGTTGDFSTSVNTNFIDAGIIKVNTELSVLSDMRLADTTSAPQYIVSSLPDSEVSAGACAVAVRPGVSLSTGDCIFGVTGETGVNVLRANYGGAVTVTGDLNGGVSSDATFRTHISSAAGAADGVLFSNEAEIQWPDTKIAEVGTNINITASRVAFGDWASGGASSQGVVTTQYSAASATSTASSLVIYPGAVLDANDLVLEVRDNSAANYVRIDNEGDIINTGVVDIGSFTDDSATTGNRTVNKQCGINAFAAAATAITITNSYVTAATAVLCTLNTNDATATLKNCATAAGSFTATITAGATGTTKLAWCVVGF